MFTWTNSVSNLVLFSRFVGIYVVGSFACVCVCFCWCVSLLFNWLPKLMVRTKKIRQAFNVPRSNCLKFSMWMTVATATTTRSASIKSWNCVKESGKEPTEEARKKNHQKSKEIAAFCVCGPRVMCGEWVVGVLGEFVTRSKFAPGHQFDERRGDNWQ